MAASQSGVFSLQEFSDLGVMLVGGRLYTYAQGTTTQKTAYTDAAGSVAHTYTSDGIGGQYIALNARGEIPAPLYLTTGSYDLALKTAAGATIWTRRADPTNEAPAAALAAYIASVANTSDVAQGDALVGVKQPFSGAVARTQHAKNAEFISITDFGAIANGTDCRAAIQAAHDASLNVYYPAGDYSTTGKIQLRVGTRIQGESAGSARLLLLADMAGTTDALYECKVLSANFGTQQAGIVVRDIALIGNAHFGHGFLLQNIRFPIFENVWAFNFNGSALVIDYAEEGYFNFMNINGCGRSSGDVTVSANTLYGQITFDSSVLAVGGVSSNFLRFNDCTIANDRCSGTIMTKGGSPSRIYFSRCQSELSGAAISNRDWFLANGSGGIFFFEENDVVNYRACFSGVHYVELYATGNRVTNSTYYYTGANGTGVYRGQGNTTGGSVESTSITTFCSVNDSLGACNFQFIFQVQLEGCQLSSLVVNDISGTPSLRVIGCEIAGNLTIGSFSGAYIAAFNIIRGAANFGNATTYGNVVIGAATTSATQLPVAYTGTATAAAALSITLGSDVALVSGNTNITSISNPGSFTGRKVTLIFSGTPTVTDGGNLKLAGNFVATADDTLTLVCDGTNFYEVARSVN